MSDTTALIKQRILEAQGITEAEVVSAVELPEEVYSALERRLQQAKGRVRLRRLIDPSLIGGMVLKLGDTVIDGSVRAQLYRAGGESSDEHR
ncbi:MAG: F0F1 ATP synthase subunit delta [Deinococcus sp.]|nr:F0F1 ATP synthase subunit delta [Deinococcus sp.]